MNTEEPIIDILERQHARFEFKNGKVEYFSISTYPQHGNANSIEEAIATICEADSMFNSKTQIGYLVEKYEEEHPIKQDSITPKNVDELVNKFIVGSFKKCL